MRNLKKAASVLLAVATLLLSVPALTVPAAADTTENGYPIPDVCLATNEPDVTNFCFELKRVHPSRVVKDGVISENEYYPLGIPREEIILKGSNGVLGDAKVRSEAMRDTVQAYVSWDYTHGVNIALQYTSPEPPMQTFSAADYDGRITPLPGSTKDDPLRNDTFNDDGSFKAIQEDFWSQTAFAFNSGDRDGTVFYYCIGRNTETGEYLMGHYYFSSPEDDGHCQYGYDPTYIPVGGEDFIITYGEDNLVTMEWSIPFSSLLGRDPEDGERFGFSMTLTQGTNPPDEEKPWLGDLENNAAILLGNTAGFQSLAAKPTRAKGKFTDPITGQVNTKRIAGNLPMVAIFNTTDPSDPGGGDEPPVHTHTWETVTVDPTCTEAGYTADVCTECGTESNRVTIPALGHNYNAVYNPDGSITFICSRCSDSYVINDGAMYDALAGFKATYACAAHNVVHMEFWTGSELTVENMCALLLDAMELDASGYSVVMDEGELNTLHDLFVNVEDGSTVSGSIFFGVKNVATGEEIEAIEVDVEIRKLVEKEEAFNAIIVCPEISPVYDEAEKALEGLFCADDSHENAEQIHLIYQSTDYYSEGFITSAILGYLGLDDSYSLNFRSFDGENPGKFYARIEKQTGHVWDISREYAFVPSWDPFSSDIIALTGSHVTDHVHDYTAAVTAPTCTDGGYTTYTCACGDSYVDDYVDALGHNFGEWTVTTAPTCTEAGEETRYCSRCDAFETRTADALGHTPGQTVIENEVTETCTVGHYWEEVVYCTVCQTELSREVKSTEAPGHNYEGVVTAPTCTEQGCTTWTCSRCGDSYVSDYVDALGHAWDDGVVTLAPTEEDDGVMLYTCTRCQETREEVIPALGHTHSYTSEVIAPTCTEQGYTKWTCRCGDTYNTDYTDALGHDYVGTVTAPTCTEGGFTTYVCSRCQDSYVADYTQKLGHAWSTDPLTWTIITDPSCTEAGLVSVPCTRCDATREVEVPAYGHDYEAVVTAPTCTEQGYTTHTCFYCADVYVDSYVDALGHAWDDGVVTLAPTEEDDGVMLYTCTRCQETREEVIPALGHTHNYVSEVIAPTCTEQGYTKWTCRCGDTYNTDYVDALGHNFGEWTVTTAPTCTEAGEETRYCSRCDAFETRIADALGHTPGQIVIENEVTETCTVGHYWEEVIYCTVCQTELSREVKSTEAPGHNYVDAVTAPTCTERGCTTWTCSRCSDSYVTDYVDALGHDWDEGVVTLEPTEETEGVKVLTCRRCQETKEEVVPALAHVHVYEAVVTEPTCTDRGYTTYTCVKGDHSYVANYVAALGHDFGDWTETTAPTCTRRGEETRYCSRCDAYETRLVSALGHNYSGAVTAPTCTERGYTTYTCSRCGDSYVSDYVAALGHTAGQTVIENEVTPTCTVGHYWEEVVYCTVCGEEISREAKSTEALGHDWDEGVVTTPPTETTEGVRTYTCRRCGSTYDEIIPALDHKPGDVTGDGIVNTKDLLRLMKYLSGENVTVSEGALDVDGNGVVNTKDLIRLLKYLSGADVEIF